MLHSFTLLTINADGHDLMCQFHKPVDEKRMVVILPTECHDHWLKSKPQDSMYFMRALPYTESASQCCCHCFGSRGEWLKTDTPVETDHSRRQVQCRERANALSDQWTSQGSKKWVLLATFFGLSLAAL